LSSVSSDCSSISDFTLGAGVAYVKRLARDLAGATLGTEQRRAYLRTIAVGDNDAVARGTKRDDLGCGSAGVRQLLGKSTLLPGTDQRVAADSD
jgi:hypothetical protein